MKTPMSDAAPCRPGARLNTLIAAMLLMALAVAGLSVAEYQLLDTLLPVARVGVVLLTWIVMLAVFAAAITRLAERTLRKVVPQQPVPCR